MEVNVIAFRRKSKGVTPLHLAAEGGHQDIKDELLDRGADIDARTKGACGWTPLHSAAKAKKRETVKFLIENGAFLPEDINDSRFNPPLHYCPGLKWAYEEMKRLLLPVRFPAVLEAKRLFKPSRCLWDYCFWSPYMRC